MLPMLDTAANPALDTPQQVAGNQRPTPSGSRPSGPRWHVVATHSQAERRATYNLAQQGYETYLPLVTVRRRDNAIRSLMHRVEVPLFAGYVFVRFDAARDPWRPITNTPGVYALLRSSSTGIPEPVRAGAVEALQAGNEARRSIPPPGASWAPGAACSPGKGHPLAGHPAVIVSVGQNMALIAVMMFGELREVTVDVNCLMPRD
jgi:transcriptional antiterminator RfaH